MAVFDNLINENEPGSLEDNIKENFTSSVPSMLRSLCAGLIETDVFLTSASNLSTLRAIRVVGDTLDTNRLNLTEGVEGMTINLGSYLKQQYQQWNCSDSIFMCTEICVGTVLVSEYNGN